MTNSIPAGWLEACIEDISTYVQRGKSPKYIEYSDLPVINQKCIRWHGVDPQWLKFVHPDQWDKWTEERFLQDGDVLWNSTGTGTIGRAAVFHRLQGFERAVVDSHVTIVRCSEYLPKLLHYWIMSPFIQSKIEGMQVGSTNQVELSKAEVLATKVKIPPLPEQHRIVDAIESYFTRLDSVERTIGVTLAKLSQLRRSILVQAFEGKLVEQDPNDEPASVLLERIKAEREAMQPHKRRRAGKQKKNEPTTHDKQLDLLGGSDK